MKKRYWIIGLVAVALIGVKIENSIKGEPQLLKKAEPLHLSASNPQFSSMEIGNWLGPARQVDVEAAVKKNLRDPDSAKFRDIYLIGDRAAASPTRRANACWCLGRRSAVTEMKMRLSMPRTISSAVSVSKAAQIAGLVSHSMRAIRASSAIA